MSKMDPIYVTTRKAIKVSLDPTQPESRYRTRQLEISTSGKNKMVKTVFNNLKDVAKDMGTQPAYIIKFIGYSLHARVNDNSVAGKYSAETLSKVMIDFVTQVICCQMCNKPEITLNSTIKECRSCGTREKLRVDTKFYKYVKSHSNSRLIDPFECSAQEVRYSESLENSGSVCEKEEASEDEIVWYTDVSSEAVAQRKFNAIGESSMKALID